MRCAAAAVCALALTPTAHGQVARGKAAAPLPMIAPTAMMPTVLAPTVFALGGTSPAGLIMTPGASELGLPPTVMTVEAAPNPARAAAVAVELGPPPAVMTVEAAPNPAKAPSASELVMSRLRTGEIEPRLAAERIAGSRNVDEALAALVELRLLNEKEVPQGDAHRLFLLKRVWDSASPALLADQLPIARSWSVPAIKASETRLIHTVAHGATFAPNRREVLALAREIAAKGETLYVEQDMWAHYGFVQGKELNDHAFLRGGLVTALAPGPSHELSRQVLQVARWTVLTSYSSAATLAGWGAAHVAGAAGAAAVAAIAAAGLWLLLSGRLALLWEALIDLRLARRARRAGLPDFAAQMRREAVALHRRRLDPNDVLRLTLPPGLEYDPHAGRSEAMVQAVLADAGDRAKVVHFLVGYAHGAYAAWRLKGLDGGPSDTGVSPK